MTRPSPPPEPADTTAEELKKRALRAANRHRRPRLFAHLAHVGVLGWMFMLPVLLFSYLGHHVSGRTGELWPAVLGVLAGIGLGAYLVYRSVSDGLRKNGEGP